jgi:hypothetical protein
MWVTFVGELNGTTVTASLLRFSGPPLGEVWDDAEVQSAVVGNVTIDFSSARAAGFSYTIDGVSDSLNLQPFNPLAGGIYSKVWWDPNRSGQAVQILHENNQISGAWYVYDENGEGMWTTFSGTLAAGSITTELLRFSGPPLGSIWDENQVSSRVAGSIKLNFQSETAASMTYTLNGITGSLALQPFNL